MARWNIFMWSKRRSLTPWNGHRLPRNAVRHHEPKRAQEALAVERNLLRAVIDLLAGLHLRKRHEPPVPFEQRSLCAANGRGCSRRTDRKNRRRFLSVRAGGKFPHGRTVGFQRRAADQQSGVSHPSGRKLGSFFCRPRCRSKDGSGKIIGLLVAQLPLPTQTGGGRR